MELPGGVSVAPPPHTAGPPNGLDRPLRLHLPAVAPQPSSPPAPAAAGSSASFRTPSPPAGSLSPLTPNMPQHSATRARFDEFFRARDLEKTAVYKRVVFLSFFVGLTHALILIVALALMYTTEPGQPLFRLFGAVMAYGIFVGSASATVVVTVPVAEFDVDERLSHNPRVRRALLVALGLMSTLLGAVFLTMFPFAPGVPLLLLGPCILLDECREERRRLWPTTKVTLFLVLLAVPIIAINAMAGLSPASLTVNLAIRGLWADWAAALARFQPTTTIIYTATAGLYALAFAGIAVAWHRCARLGEAAGKGWRTHLLYAAIFCWTITTGVVSIMQCVPVLLGQDTMTPASVPYYIASCSFVLLPPLAALAVGPRNVFTLVARYFEYDLGRLKKDGALMAELAASSMVVDTNTNTRWVYRAVKSDLPFAGDRHAVQRCFWALGRIVSFAAHGDELALQLRVSMREDRDPSWSARFVGANVVFSGAGGGGAPPFPAGEFEAWVEANFAPEAVIEKSATEQAVTLRATLSGRGSTRHSLEAWATDNLRLFEWSNFDDELLHKSPRQLGSDEERAALFARSRHARVTRNSDKLDYFVSHSWDDAPAPKCRALRAFMEAQRGPLRGAYPTLWLDKVCIDQRNPGNALAVLPINIGACKKVLILLSPSYLTRLWCVWELFTLFTFCYKELAVARVQVVPLGDARVGEFDIDHAHCFDPNEEFKLRQIIHDIGVHRLTECLAVMSGKLARTAAE